MSKFTPFTINKEWIIMLLRVQSKHTDFKPNAIVDVGANQGEWSATIRKYFPDTKLLLIEASEQHDQQLQRLVERMGNAEFKIALLTDVEGVTTQYYAGGNKDQTIQESFLKNEIVDVIKADVQGAELLVLKGGIRALSQATFVFLEVSLVEYNEGGSCFYDMDEFLREHGFYLYDMAGFTSHPTFKTDGIGQFDVLYVKPTSPRLPNLLKEMKPMYCGQRQASPLDSQVICDTLENGQTAMIPTWFLGFAVGILFGTVVARYLYPRSAINRKR